MTEDNSQSTTLTHRIDFKFAFAVNHANPNGDPLNNNYPRTLSDGRGEVSDVALKRKIRNRWHDFGQNILIMPADTIVYPEPNDIYSRLTESDAYKQFLEEYTAHKHERPKAVFKTGLRQVTSKTWLDVRAFGQLFSFKNVPDKNFDKFSLGIRGPVSIWPAFSLDPVDIDSMQITKSLNLKPSDSGERGSDTMGRKNSIDFGLYVSQGSISVPQSQMTGFSNDDAELLKKALATLFVNDESSARPVGSMEIVRLDWWTNDYADETSADGHPLLSAKELFDAVQYGKKDGVERPRSLADYVVDDQTPDYVTHDVVVNRFIN
ncbi:type I-C CRISPR-associated protein Cas7/Csd2 [Schleiferilactobacillus harbinensis]|uniref:Type I-C CRISPR-associated protein Cas7/Csd2 n=1 Tax=Schleiferilactobacillus harbinensis TaxID=304207 RepID=A0ABU7T2B5_9LACO|nr:type I-C CRISPR-associated protein Cas7/Csd2 [Schleiferilactobacillus harbinensis]